MNVAVMKTKAEQAFSERFEAVAGKLPGGTAVRDARRKAIGSFAGQGLPHRRIEEWKYTDLRNSLKDAFTPALGYSGQALAAADIAAALGPFATLDAHCLVFVDGLYQPHLSQLVPTPGLEVLALGEALSGLPDKVTENLVRTARDPDAVVALNTAFVTDGAVVRVAEGASIEKPIL